MTNAQPIWSSPDDEIEYEDDVSIDLERAIAELRFGRPVVLTEGRAAAALLALDGATPAQYEVFRVKSSNRHALYLSCFRANALGLGSDAAGVSVKLHGSDYSAAARLAYAPDVTAPSTWRPAPSLLASVCDIARLAQLLPAFVYTEIDGQDPSFARCLRLPGRDSLRRLAPAMARFRCITRAAVPLEGLGECQCLIFRGGLAQRDQLAIIVGAPDLSKTTPVRLHSSCITGDLLGSLKCDCGDQLRTAMTRLAELGGGILLYLDHEGRGTGLASKLRAYGYQGKGLDTIEADAQLGFGPDEREYGAAAAMLRQLNVGKINLLTNNPAKAEYLAAQGLLVEACTSVTGKITAENSSYLRTKADRGGHLFPPGYLENSARNSKNGSGPGNLTRFATGDEQLGTEN